MDDSPSIAKQFSLTSLFVLVTVAATSFWLCLDAYPYGPLVAWFCWVGVVGATASKRDSRGWGVLFAVMLSLGVLAMPYLMMEGHCVSPYRLNRVQPGANFAEVESILGPPSSVTNDPAGSRWVYSASTWCHVVVSFDASGEVEQIVHDH
ncbi:outer membrane protein assembly factor BamE [Planctomycetes bacterium K23_9]|uniref:Uncharacterized protein n=1 Tax=Stieleria marina TaxID=1930275 RepID=A0A517NVU3_9BACT|nr:hypothetical protein K239x_32460 [Planctomycetes bacterium K23_9]